MGCADPSGNVHFLVHNAVPEGFTGLQQRFIAGKARHIRHAGIKVYGAHRMPHSLLLQAHRKMRLVVHITQLLFCSLLNIRRMLPVEVIGPLPPLLNKKARQAEICFLTGHLIQTHQCHFRDLVPRIALTFPLLGPEAARDIIGKTFCGVQQPALPGRLIISDCALRQMAEAV